MTASLPTPDRPWVMRTYSGHSSAQASNELYRTNLARGQTGLSVAFDLPTQTGYDPDDPLARGEVGKVGVPVPHLGEMRTLFDGIPLEAMNTSMTINATAVWLLALYLALAEERGVDPGQLSGTTQNDIVKEYLSRGTYIFGPEPSRRLTVDLICHTVRHVPRWNPINVCSYHLQEAGATPVQEVAYVLATAIGVLDAVRESGQVSPDEFPEVVGRISFFVNAGIRFIEEMCKLRVFGRLWDEICVERYGVTDEKLRRFRYGVQVNSLGLTEAQPENNVQRIVLETLGVTLSRDARARAVQLPTWNEALGLPRPWDQQWSLRIQQVLAQETDLLEYPDLFEGSVVIEAKTRELAEAAEAELAWVLEGGGAFAMIDAMKSRLVASLAERVRRIETGEIPVVGVNCLTESAESPLVRTLDGESHILVVDPAAENEQRARLTAWRAACDDAAVTEALDALRVSAATTDNLVAPSIALARAGGTVGEWARVLRDVFGEYRGPTGVGGAASPEGRELAETGARMRAAAGEFGGPARLLVAKPGLDGHSNGAEQIALAARDAGFEVVYQGIRQTPEEIVAAARDEDVDVIGLSILSGSHLEIVPETVRLLRAAGVDAPVVVGGIIPPPDQAVLTAAGVARVYTPKDYRLSAIISDLADLAFDHRRGDGRGPPLMNTLISYLGTALFVAIAAGGSVHLLNRRRLHRAERALRRSEQARDKLRQELETLNRLFADTAARARALGTGRADELAGDAFDPISGLLRERFVAVLIQQRVAGARRRLHPVAVVALEADGIRGSSQPDVDNAMRALGGVMRETLREADCACRVGDVVVIAALDDTTEEGARLAIERVQAGLRTATGDLGITVSAGIVRHPTHALDAPELVARAGEALLEARTAGTSRVATANGDVRGV